MHYSIIAQVLCGMGIGLPRQKFLQHLFSTWLSVRGRFNFTNVSRYAFCDERTMRRGFERGLSWPEFNGRLLAGLIPADHEMIAAMDASFVPKSGKRTFGLGHFYSGCAGRALRGLEVSLMSVVDVTANTGYALGARQTPPGEVTPGSGGKRKCRNVRHKSKAQESGEKTGAATGTRMDAYLKHFEAVRPSLPGAIRHLAVDGFYTNRKFVGGVCALGMEIVGKLRRDANLRYLYNGPQKSRGRRRLYAGKVQWSNLDMRRWKSEGAIEKGIHLYSASLYHASLKRVIRVVLLLDTTPAKTRSVLLFSTDLKLPAQTISRYYKARFQIEFLFRDAKQGTGLNHCQARNEKALHFHWNAALCMVNLAKCQQVQNEPQPGARHTFSVASCKLRSSNEHLLEVFSRKLGLDWMSVKSHPAYSDLCSYGVIQQ